MASAWGTSWGASWGSSWGQLVPPSPSSGNAVVPNTVADLRQLFQATAYGVPVSRSAPDVIPLGPTLADLERRRHATRTKRIRAAEHDELLAVFALFLAEDDE